MRPIIGVTCPWSEETWGATIEGGGYDYAGRAYSAAIARAGGIPVLLPVVVEEDLETYARQLLETVNGLYFTGGGNVSIKRPAGALPTLYEQQPQRSRWESTLLRLAYERDIPCLGVCRGHQMMAVVLGGGMDTERFPQHKQTVAYDIGVHDVFLSKDSRLAQIVGEDPWLVNSIHVERVLELPDGFSADARALDGSIEAISATNRTFFMGTQFHPELMPQDARGQRLFEAFIRAAEKK